MKPKHCFSNHWSRLLRCSAGALAGAALLALALDARAALTHRYSFATDATDSVGGANGTLHNGAAVVDGSVLLSGLVASGPDADYVELPSGLISNYTAVTFELWVDAGFNGNWSEIYAFGNQTAAGQGANMVMVTPHSGATPNDFRMSYAQAAPGFNDEYVVSGVGILDGLGPVSITCVYDPPNNAMSLYTNGALVGIKSPVTTGARRFSLTNVYNVFSWLGRSLYNGDASYSGSINEFRIYNTALTPLQVYVNNQAGPDTVVTNITINSLTWNANSNMVVGSRQSTTVTFNTANYGSLTLPNATEPTYVSSNPDVVNVTAQGQLFALAVGSSTVSAVYNNTTNSVVVQVSPPQLIHRYTFANDANDSIGNAHGTLVGATIQGGELVLPGGGFSFDGFGYLDLPNNLLTNITAVTLEAWVTDDGSGNWARVWDLGNSVGGEDMSDTGSRYVYLALPNGGGALQGTIHVDDRVGGDASVVSPRPPVGEEAHIVWSSDIANQTSWLYVNGALVGANTVTAVSPADIGPSVNNWLGRSQFSGDALFMGSINEFRIYNGAVSPLQVSLNAASGPDQIVTDPGALQDLRMSRTDNSLQLVVIADYASISNVNVTTVPELVYQSSNPSVLTVNNTGALVVGDMGSATISASLDGQTRNLVVNVADLPGYAPATLVHRYSFSESAGSTRVEDSVGRADGTIAGNGAAFSGQGQLTLPGGTSSAADPVAGYVDLPNGIISVLTNASFEAWITWNTASQWQRIFDFGTSQGGENVSDGNGNYLFLSPQGSGNNFQFSVREPVGGTEPAPLIASAPLPTGQETYVAVVYNYEANMAQLYQNAQLVDSGAAPVDLTTINDVNNWLGRSQWGDPMFAGTYNEFRIWDGVLVPAQITSHYQAGPDSLEAAPSLTATVDGQNLVVSWPASATGFALESTSTLGAGAAWSPVTAASVTEGGVTSVTLPLGTGSQFLRLKK